MFVVFLRFSTNRARASEFMLGHNAWIARGIDDGVFLVVGSLQPGLGGAVLAHGIRRGDLEARVAEDPFVANDVVKAEILELSVAKTEPRLAFLVEVVERVTP
jgi:uncharacterized protein YciI